MLICSLLPACRFLFSGVHTTVQGSEFFLYRNTEYKYVTYVYICRMTLHGLECMCISLDLTQGILQIPLFYGLIIFNYQWTVGIHVYFSEVKPCEL